MSENQITAVCMMISGFSFAIAVAASETNYDRAMAVGCIWLLNTVIKVLK